MQTKHNLLNFDSARNVENTYKKHTGEMEEFMSPKFCTRFHSHSTQHIQSHLQDIYTLTNTNIYDSCHLWSLGWAILSGSFPTSAQTTNWLKQSSHGKIEHVGCGWTSNWKGGGRPAAWRKRSHSCIKKNEIQLKNHALNYRAKLNTCTKTKCSLN